MYERDAYSDHDAEKMEHSEFLQKSCFNMKASRLKQIPYSPAEHVTDEHFFTKAFDYTPKTVSYPRKDIFLTSHIHLSVIYLLLKC